MLEKQNTEEEKPGKLAWVEVWKYLFIKNYNVIEGLIFKN